MRIQIINGPNINLLGKREPGIYGAESFESYLEKLRTAYPDLEIDYYQSNIEGEMIDKIHEVGFEDAGIILNAGAYTHTSIALQDAIRAVTAPVVEVHISNVHKPEEFMCLLRCYLRLWSRFLQTGGRSTVALSERLNKVEIIGIKFK